MRPSGALRTLNDANRTAQRALVLAEAGRKLMDAEDEDRLTAQLFASAGELLPLPHWWRNRFDAEGGTTTTHWTPSLLALFPTELITAPLRTESLHVDLNRRLHQ